MVRDDRRAWAAHQPLLDGLDRVPFHLALFCTSRLGPLRIFASVHLHLMLPVHHRLIRGVGGVRLGQLDLHPVHRRGRDGRGGDTDV